MEDKNNNDIKVNITQKGLVKDINKSLVSENLVTHARNAMMNTHLGDQVFYTNEPSNYLCVTLPYTFNGEIPLKDNKMVVFSSNGQNSEIGIVDKSNCTYKKLVNSDCLNFNYKDPITGVSKEDLEGNEIIIWRDNYNPPRIMNISNIPYTFTISDDECKTKNYSNQLDCDAILLYPTISFPCVDIQRGFGGNLPDGVYHIAIAYIINGQKFTDYYGITTPIFVNNKEGVGSLDIEILNLDRKFDDYQIVLIGVVDGIQTNKLIGIYSTSTSKIKISDWNRTEFQTVSSSDLIITKKNYTKAGSITHNSQYVMFSDLTRKPDINYQPLAFEIKPEYVVHQYDENYYKNDGKDIGYYRDENYSFLIRWFWKDGEPTKHFLISGEEAKGNEKALYSGVDAYELDSNYNECDKPDKIEEWQITNTAGKLVKLQNEFKCGYRELGYGTFGYHESIYKYPDVPEIYGENACKNIRYVRFPNESIVPRYEVIDNVKYINVLGVRFKNIQHPIDENGEPIKDIVGYEILRASRDHSNKTIIARGLLSNARGYTETQSSNSLLNTQEVVYANYPYNDRNVDIFLSSKEVTRKKNREQNFVGLDKVYKDKFNFFTPHGYFDPKYKMGTEFVIDSEEVAFVTGYFEEVFQHPKHKLLTDFSLWFSILTGAIQAYLTMNGKKCVSKTNETSRMVVSGSSGSTTTGNMFATEVITDCDTMFHTAKVTKPVNFFAAVQQIAVQALQIIAAIASFVFVAAEFADNAVQIIKNFSPFQQYALQYNSHAEFLKSIPVLKDNKRRKVLRQPLYLSDNLHSLGNLVINNYKRQPSIFVEFEKEIKFPSTPDNTRGSVSTFNLCDNLSGKTSSTASMFYATSKVKNPGQYGNPDSVVPVKMHNCILPAVLEIDTTNASKPYNSPTLFGGDCIISKFRVNTKFPMFQQTLAGSNYEDGTEFNYKLYRNVAYNRYWADFTSYQISDIVSKNPQQGKLPDQKYNLDCIGNSKKKKDWIVKNQYLYTHINGVLDFFVETDYNISFREENTENKENNLYSQHYSDKNSNLSRIFRSDDLDKIESFSLNPSYKYIETKEVYSQHDTELNLTPIREQNSLIYSLPSFTGQKFNNWQYFLPNNYFVFDEKDFGKLTGIHQIDQDKIIFLFTNSSPFISMGRDELQTTSGRKITIGDGGLFAQQPRELLHTDVGYASSQSKYAFSSNQFGHFYVSSNQGRIFNFSGGLDDVTKAGFHYWCSTYMPLFFSKQFPEYKDIDNPLKGLGYKIVFDNIYETVYIIKRDWVVKEEFKNSVFYDKDSNKFFFRSLPIEIGNPDYFEDASWTLSYSPTNQCFISHHDWHPDWVIQENSHFLSVKDNKIYRHNDRCDNFCNYYDKDYPYELEYTVSTGQNIHILRSIEFENEVFINKNNCRDRFQEHHTTFNKMVVHNNDQISGYLELEYQITDKQQWSTYPKPGNGTMSQIIPYSYAEHKFRVNMFHDMVKDRGQYTNSKENLWITKSNGYERVININSIDMSKPERQRKAFRNYNNSIWFARDVCGPLNFVNKFFNSKITYSLR